jgi:hypothetical protein
VFIARAYRRLRFDGAEPMPQSPRRDVSEMLMVRYVTAANALQRYVCHAEAENDAREVVSRMPP